MATILETINTVTDKIVSLVGTRANKDLSNLTALGEAKLVSGTSGLPVGTVIAYMGTDVPTGYLLMDGRTLSRTTYAALFKVIGTTQGAGDGSTTFGIADMTDGRYLMGSTVAGGSREDGLPNITGRIGKYNTGLIGGVWGAIYVNSTSAGSRYLTHSADSPSQGEVNFSASGANPIYGRSATVTPKSMECKYFIKY